MSPILIISLVVLVVIVALLAVVMLRKRSFGVLSGNSVYSDTDKIPGEVLYSDSFYLKGKPDYIIKKDGQFIPVEVKTGKTPAVPYQNHVAQLFAYCVLVQEKYGVRPKYGVIKYPEQEFEVEYTEMGEKGVQKMILEMIEMKKSGVEPQCKHTEHNK